MIVKIVTKRAPGAPHVSMLFYAGDDPAQLKHIGVLTFGLDDVYQVVEEPGGKVHGMTGLWSTMGALFAFAAKKTGSVDIILEGDSEVNRQLEWEAKHVH